MIPQPAAFTMGIQHDPGALYDQGEFVIPSEPRRNHTAIFGTTGAGKSTLMRNMIAEDIAAGIGCTVLDPHGQLVEDILDHHIPRHRTDDVIYFRPRDPLRVIVLNLLDSPRPAFDDIVVQNAVSIFKQLWPDAFSVGARMEDIFYNSFRALIEHPSPTSLWNLPRLLNDTAYRAVILRKVKNPAVKSFFEHEYNTWTPSFREQAISPVLNKCRPFLADRHMRAVIGAAHSTIRFRTVLDQHKILLCDLAKGEGQDNARLLGSLIAMQEKLAAISRSDIPEADRAFHMLYVEEAHNFIADFEAILSETRKFHLGLVIATQAIEQLPKKAVTGIFGNCATQISFRVQSADAERLRDEFGTFAPFPAEALQQLPNYDAYVRTLFLNQAGVPYPSDPHLVTTYPPLPTDRRHADREHIIRTSAERWTRPRAKIEANLKRFLKREF